MFNKFVFCFTFFFATVLSTSSSAATVLEVSGVVTDIEAIQNGENADLPSGQIEVGDAYKLKASFDLGLAEISALFNADPNINIYSLPGTSVSYQIGSFSREFRPRFSFNSSLQIWDNNLVGTRQVDAQSFSFFDFDLPVFNAPFDTGIGQTSISTTLNNFDNTASVRSNDLIDELAPLSDFGTQLFSLGQLNADTGLFVFVRGSVLESSLNSAVPEPATWAMMIFGFLALGAYMRLDKRCALGSTS